MAIIIENNPLKWQFTNCGPHNRNKCLAHKTVWKCEFFFYRFSNSINKVTRAYQMEQYVKESTVHFPTVKQKFGGSQDWLFIRWIVEWKIKSKVLFCTVNVRTLNTSERFFLFLPKAAYTTNIIKTKGLSYQKNKKKVGQWTENLVLCRTFWPLNFLSNTFYTLFSLSNICCVFILSIIFSSTASLVSSEKIPLLYIAQKRAVSIRLHQRLQW